MSHQEVLGPRLSRMDRWGIIISSACLVHCLALPLAIALLPAIASSLPSDSWVHPVLIGLALPVTGGALWRGYRTHLRAVPALLGALGLGFIASALFARGGLAEPALTVFGGLLVSAAHILNWRGTGSSRPHVP
ncbi:membrane protein [Sphingobium sp. TA15]|uniref:MerC domain-containing protein n=1 Tax=Sphingobium TaxID=165695 RepID=UPI0011D05BF2|nr:MerC domain-containing protein [Sphingobium indicum]BDD66169.1 membrane protein [Sphingobium sp. TA15]